MSRTWRWLFVSGTWFSCACGARTIDTSGFDDTGASGTSGRGGASGSSASSGGAAGRAGAGGTSVSSGGASGRGGAGGASSGGVFGAGGAVNPGGASGAGGSTNPGGAAGVGGSFTGMRSVTLVTDTFVIGPGEEAFKCQTFANPFGVSVDVFKTESHMPSGSHHMLAFFEDGARDGSVYDCGGLEFSPPLHGAQTPDYVREYPEGVGFRFEASEGLRFNMHWLNTTSQPINAKVELTIVAGPAGSAKQQAGFMFLNNLGISIAAHSKGTATKTCSVPSNVGIVELISHMHQRATHIVAKTGSGRVIYESDDWDHPTPSRFSPPLSLGTDTSITWTCSYDNPDDFAVGFGPSAATSEMCILNGTFFPAASRLSACL